MPSMSANADAIGSNASSMRWLRAGPGYPLAQALLAFRGIQKPSPTPSSPKPATWLASPTRAASWRGSGSSRANTAPVHPPPGSHHSLRQPLGAHAVGRSGVVVSLLAQGQRDHRTARPKLDPQIRELAWKAQLRLTHKYRRLRPAASIPTSSSPPWRASSPASSGMPLECSSTIKRLDFGGAGFSTGVVGIRDGVMQQQLSAACVPRVRPGPHDGTQ